MRGNELLYKMELIKPAYVEAADSKPKKKKSHMSYVRWGTIAACFAFVVCIITGLFPQQQKNLPMLSISKNPNGHGYEGYMAYEISELVNANPWNENLKISALPVYQNHLTYDQNYIASGADFDEMRELLLEVAERLGLDKDTLTVTDDAPSEERKQKTIEKYEKVGAVIPDGYFDPTMLIIETEGLRIEVDQTLTATVRFEPAISLPSQYNFTHYASYNDLALVAEYLKAEYKDFIGIKDPQVNIYGGDYNIYAQQSYSIEFFDGNGKTGEKIINYNFNRVTFSCNDEGKLFIARLFQPNLSEKVGNYPIISLEQAENLLSSGNYITSIVHCDMPGVDYVRKAELVYRTGKYEAYYMPYYRFFVELPEEEQENGLKTYGAYYVPAVESKYISNMPMWDGSFN